ncbi:MAG: hypothetical protein MUE83_13505 [Tabrizicola sp.]|jgi:hypothetical protein|nr:hypothetical protein [Tabrizicola sp.]
MSEASTPKTPQAMPPKWLSEKLGDALCDAEQLHGLVRGAELAMDLIEDGPEGCGYRRISRQDEKTLAALLRSARQLAEKLEGVMGELA